MGAWERAGGLAQPKNNNKKKKDKIDSNYNHAPNIGCSCFGCYKSFWARWDASPNRHVIHLILDAFEETLESKEANSKKKRGLKSKKIDFDEVLAKEMSAHEEKVDDDGHDDGCGHVTNYQR
ncbi:uncharacterized protein LOC109820929 [Asparagus officinalis]|uniref:uncharacterized protein LOC109820929 n=1 Tax=Asparagus officinalis TaxID=4686 RepID=UPI00098E47E8|nr:uncharacterized protein LOC109820929 [Asparagus officinalis]